MTWGGKIGQLEAGRQWKGGWEGEGHFSATDCHTVYRLFMNKLCVSLGHCCGPVTMASMVRGRGMRSYWATGIEREGGEAEIWRGVFALDYFNRRSHLHLLARAQPLSLSSSALPLSLYVSLSSPSSSHVLILPLKSVAPALSLFLSVFLRPCHYPFILTCSLFHLGSHT